MLWLFCWIRPLKSILAQWAVATRHEVRPFNGSLLILEHTTRAAALMKPTPPAIWKMKKWKEMWTLGVGTAVIANRYDITMVVQTFAFRSFSCHEKRSVFALYHGAHTARQMGCSRTLQQLTAVYCPFYPKGVLSALKTMSFLLRNVIILHSKCCDPQHWKYWIGPGKYPEKGFEQSSHKQTGRPRNISVLSDTVSIRNTYVEELSDCCAAYSPLYDSVRGQICQLRSHLFKKQTLTEAKLETQWNPLWRYLEK